VPSPPTWNEAVPPGTVLLGKYRIDSILGKGGMGIVAEATHLALGEKVALKMLRPDVIADAEACSRFLREAQAAVKLKSEHVARVTDVGTLEGGSPYMVMEFLEGVDLDQMLTASGVVAPGLAIEFVLQGCEALAEAHSLGIIHRDVKPSNFFVTWRPDGTPLVKVLDFGISKAPVGVDLQLTRTQSVLGTPAYMSPEQMRSARNVDARTDVWSLGTVLYELIEGHRPFEAESFSEMCVKVAADPPMPMQCAELPPGLEAVILRCLEKDPARRWQNIGELAAGRPPVSRAPPPPRSL
jgi:serine/threonine protein kinase